ncbi:MAG: ATP cone domain-containing protein [Candidatus Paceibacterota bacterium]|jgi:hypothetical protein
MREVTIRKANGERQAFDIAKLVESLSEAGADSTTAQDIARHIEQELHDGMTTHEIYSHAFRLLRKTARPVAATYSIRRAVQELGPDGFPFERFIAEIFKAKGYEAVNDQIVQGGCVEHEMDVVAWNKDKLIMVEAKFHNELGIKSDLKVALYIKARFDDLAEGAFDYGGRERKLDEGWLITNTKFTDMAIRYGECQKLNMVGWNYPARGNLQHLIEEADFHPLTVLTTLTKNEKFTLLHRGLVLVKHVIEREHELESFGIPRENIARIIEEAREIFQ